MNAKASHISACLIVIASIGMLASSIAYASFSSSFTGKVRSMVVDGMVKARLYNPETKQDILVNFCNDTSGSNIKLRAEEQLNLMRAAMANGYMVKVGYNSLFDRCVTELETLVPEI